MEVEQGTAGIPSIACALPPDRERARRDELSRGLFARHEGAAELADGYEFRFPGDARLVGELARFIADERECCPFLHFELLVEPDRGPIRLRVRGPEGTKEFLAGQLTEGAYSIGERD